jgi:hypothetical protein
MKNQLRNKFSLNKETIRSLNVDEMRDAVGATATNGTQGTEVILLTGCLLCAPVIRPPAE